MCLMMHTSPEELTYTHHIMQSTIGGIIGSHAWKGSGEQAKAHAVDTLKAAGEARDPAASGYGAAEQKLGEVTGCGGMQKEGAASKKSE